MNLTNKYNALEEFRLKILPRVKVKYESNNITSAKHRKLAWGKFIAFLELKKIISTKTRKQWELDSDWTSKYFILDLINLI